MIGYGNTDIGRVRKVNEDDFCLLHNQHDDWIAVVCDGIGGSAAGEVASHMAIGIIKDAFENAPAFQKDFEVQNWLTETLNKANDEIYYHGMHSVDQHGMGTTCVGFITLMVARIFLMLEILESMQNIKRDWFK